MDDVVDLVRADRTKNPDRPVVGGSIFVNKYQDLWGEPAEACWTQEVWMDLLKEVSDFVSLHVLIPNSCSLMGLFHCCTETTFNLPDDEVFTIGFGTAPLAEVEACVQRIKEHGSRISLE